MEPMEPRPPEKPQRPEVPTHLDMPRKSTSIRDRLTQWARMKLSDLLVRGLDWLEDKAEEKL